MRRFCYCDSDTGEVLRFETFPDNHQVPTAVGTKLASQIEPCTKATITFPGATGNNGKMIYTAKHGGKVGNKIRVEHVAGEEGPEHINRLLEVVCDGFDISVNFGTDEYGNILVPTAANVADLINNDEAASRLVSAATDGDGDGEVPTAPLVPLIGGKDDGDWRKFRDKGGNCRRVNTVEVI